MTTSNYPLNNPGSYIRVQTNYYKKCLQPTINGHFIEVWVPWSAEMLKQDLAKNYIKKIHKFDGFACVPSHLNFQETEVRSDQHFSNDVSIDLSRIVDVLIKPTQTIGTPDDEQSQQKLKKKRKRSHRL